MLWARVMSIRSLLFVLPFLSLSACGADTDLVEDDGAELSADDGTKADRASAPNLYYSVRRDTRRCIFPACGGYWLQKANSTTAEVYVAEIDFSRAGLDEADTHAFDVAGSVVRGSLAPKTYGTFGQRMILSADGAWALGAGAPSGTFFRLTDTGRVCFRAPCFNIAEKKLNWSTATKLLSGVTGATAADALSALYGDDEILASGTNRSGARGAKDVAITAYWKRVQHNTSRTCAGVTCDAGTVCEMIQVVCITTPCDPVPTCVMTDEHLVELAKVYAFAHQDDPSYTKRFFDTERAAYDAATTIPSLLWLALDGANTKFVWGYNDLWAERFEIDRITGDVRVTGEH